MESCPWNMISFTPPELKFVPGLTKRKVLTKMLNEQFRAANYQTMLCKEASLLAKFLTGRKNTYRSDKGFRSAQQVVRIARRLHLLDTASMWCEIKNNLTDQTVISKESCRWILMKLMTASLLYEQLCTYSKYGAFRLNHRLRTGHNWFEVTVAISMISRLWALSTFLNERTSSAYAFILDCVDKFPAGDELDENDILLSKYKFPSKLPIPECDRFELGMGPLPSSDLNMDLEENSPILVESTNKDVVVEFVSKLDTRQKMKQFLREELSVDAPSRGMDLLIQRIYKKQLKLFLKMLSKRTEKSNIIELLQRKLLKWLIK